MNILLKNVGFLEMCRLSLNHYLSHNGLSCMHNRSVSDICREYGYHMGSWSLKTDSTKSFQKWPLWRQFFEGYTRNANRVNKGLLINILENDVGKCPF